MRELSACHTWETEPSGNAGASSSGKLPRSAILLPACSASAQEAAAAMDDRRRQLSAFSDTPSFVGTLRGPLLSDPRPVSPEATEAGIPGCYIVSLD